jgi:hypothetical protein
MTEYEALIIIASASHHRDSAKREAEYSQGTFHWSGNWTLEQGKNKAGGN